MPYFRVNGTLMHLKLNGPKAKRPKPCCARIPSPTQLGKQELCMAFSSILCDWPLEDGGTCDAPLCAEHATEVGPDRHYCRIHTRKHLEGQADADRG